jgi:predicted RNase H-like HicB family nuclease
LAANRRGGGEFESRDVACRRSGIDWERELGIILKQLFRERTAAMRLTAVITREPDWHVAHCLVLGVVSQGKTIEEAQANLREAVELYLESFGEDIEQ